MNNLKNYQNIDKKRVCTTGGTYAAPAELYLPGTCKVPAELYIVYYSLLDYYYYQNYYCFHTEMNNLKNYQNIDTKKGVYHRWYIWRSSRTLPSRTPFGHRWPNVFIR